MRQTIVKAIILVLPGAIFSIIGIIVLTFLKKNGDTMVTKDVISQNPRLYGSAYVDNNQPYKYNKLLTLKTTEILVIGGSRSMQFESKMFNTSFYNAGGVILNLADLEFCSDKIIKKKPKWIFIGLEQYFFNPNFTLFNKRTDYWSDMKLNKVNIVGNVIKDLIKRRIKINELLANHLEKGDSIIGLRAILQKSGFERDGRQVYPLLNQNRSAKEFFGDIENRIITKTNRYESADIISTTALIRLERFLSKCRKANIKVIGYLPPWPSLIQKQLKSDGHYGAYFGPLAKKVAKIFSRDEGNLFFDFTNMDNIGATDEEFYDGHHASEKIYCRKLKHIYEHADDELKSVININYVTSIINNNKRFGI